MLSSKRIAGGDSSSSDSSTNDLYQVEVLTRPGFKPAFREHRLKALSARIRIPPAAAIGRPGLDLDPIIDILHLIVAGYAQ